MSETEPVSALLLTEQEWADLAVMVQPHVWTENQHRWAVAWSRKRPDWLVGRRRSLLAQRIIDANAPAYIGRTPPP